MKEYSVTATLTVGFWYEEDYIKELGVTDIEQFVQDEFLEWIGSASDSFIRDGLHIQIEKVETS